MVGNDADRAAVDTREGGDDVGGVVGLDFQHVVGVENLTQQVQHVVSGIGIVGNECVQHAVSHNSLVGGCPVLGRGFVAGARQVFEQVMDVIKGFILCRCHIGNVAVERLLVRATEFGRGDILAGDLTDDVGAGNVHFGSAFHGNNKVRGHRGVHRTTSAFAKHDGNLRASARQGQLAPRNFRVHGQRGHGVLDAGTTGVLDADHRAPDLDGHVHDFADFAAKRLPHRTAVDGLVVRVHGDGATVDTPIPGDHAVAVGGFRVVGGATQRTDFHERTFVEQSVNALPGAGQTSRISLCSGTFAARILCLFKPGVEVSEFFRRGGTSHCRATRFRLLLRRAPRCACSGAHPRCLFRVHLQRQDDRRVAE